MVKMNCTTGFLDHKNISLDSKIIILNGLVQKLWSHANKLTTEKFVIDKSVFLQNGCQCNVLVHVSHWKHLNYILHPIRLCPDGLLGLVLHAVNRCIDSLCPHQF